MKRTAMFLLLAILLSSCQSESNQPIEPEATEKLPVVETVIDDPLKDNLPDDLDYNGYNYTIFTFSGGNTGDTNQQYLVIEEMTGETVNDAAYTRNLEVENRLNVELTCFESAESHTQMPVKLHEYVAAGDSSIDLCVMFVSTSIHELVLNNVLYDVTKIENINTEKQYYDQNYMETFALDGSQYIMAGAYPYTVGPVCYFLFNKDEWTNLNLEDPYDLVYDGKWTHDKLLELLKNTYRDTNGNGEKDHDDFYGLDTVGAVLRVLCPGYGANVMTVDGTEYTMEVGSEKYQTIVEKIIELTMDPNVYLAPGGKEWTSFMSGNSLMQYYGSGLYRLRDIEFDFGFLPSPKLDEQQKDYTSYKLCYPVCIPSNVSDPERAGAVCEALFSTSEKYMTDAFIDTYVENKILRDEDSQKIYRMAMENAVYDFSCHYRPDGGKISDHMLVVNLIANKSTALASEWASMKESITHAFDSFFDALEETN